jgi:iron complex transport system substrate-binding protein
VRTILALVACGLLLLPAGCGRSVETDRGEGAVVVDDLGRNVSFGESPRRIISLAPSFTETLYALGADSLIAGVTTFCNYPAEARTHRTVGDLLTPDIETIVGLQPDLVLISVEGNSRQTFDRFEQLGLRCFVSNPRDLDGVLKSIEDIATIVGREERGRELTGRLRSIRDSIRRLASFDTVSVMVLLSLQPLIVAGEGTFINELILAAGGRNAVSDVRSGYPVLGREEVLLRNPDILMIPDDLGIGTERLLHSFPEWRKMSAIQRGRLHTFDADMMMRPGPRLFSVLEEVHALLSVATEP